MSAINKLEGVIIMKRKILMLVMGLVLNLLVISVIAKEIQIVAYNDFHGAITEKAKYVPGMAKYVTAIKNERSKKTNSLVVSAGDNFTGTAMSNLTFGEPVAQMMEMVGTSLSAVGNHVFDYEPEKVTCWQKKYNWNFVVANIYDKRTGKRVTWAKPYEIIKVAGVKVAFIGLTTVTTPDMTDKKFVKNVEFRDAAVELKKVIKHLKRDLKKEERPDIIIALTHIASYQDNPGESNVRGKEKAGQGDGELENICKVKGIDAVISGHSHKFVSGLCENVPVIQSSKSGVGIGTLLITLNDKNKVESIDPALVPVWKFKDKLQPDPKAEATYKKWEKKLGPILDTVIGYASGDFLHSRDDIKVVTPFGRYVCELMIDNTDTEIAIINSGAFKGTGFKKGSITNRVLYTAAPYDSRIVSMKMTGRSIRKLIEHAIYYTHGNGYFYGLDLTFKPNKKEGSKIVRLKLIDGSPLKDNQFYTVSAIDYLLEHGGYDFSEAVDIDSSFGVMRDVIKADIEKNKIIVPRSVDYVHLVK